MRNDENQANPESQNAETETLLALHGTSPRCPRKSLVSLARHTSGSESFLQKGKNKEDRRTHMKM